MGKLFGTDGIRGVANTYPMTPEMMIKIGLIVGSNIKPAKSSILIGRDTRRSGPMLEMALTAGIAASGADVQLAGIAPTPAIAFLTRTHHAKAGIVISASHNPAKDNGVKIFAHDGYKLPDDLEFQIEEAILEYQLPTDRPTDAGIGAVHSLSDAGARYVEHVLQAVFGEHIPSLSGVKVVLDCANGATASVAPAAFRRIGIEPILMAADPDGMNINLHCGATHTVPLQQRVLKEHAALGIAFDGDGDRVIFVDEQGHEVDGDQLLAILAFDLLRKHQLRQKTLVVTVMSNLGLEVAMRAAGISLVRTAVGDRQVVEKMRSLGANLGGEQSGHIIMLDHTTTGDGLLTALSLVNILQAADNPLSQLATCMTKFPQTLINVPVKSRKPFEEMVEVSLVIRQVERELGERGRVLVRYSGTELLARVMVEAEHDEVVKRTAEAIAEAIRKENL